MLPLETQLEVPARSEEIPRVRAWVVQALRSAGADGLDVAEVELVVSEACSNIVRHAYAGRSDGRIYLTLSIDAELIRLALRDFGRRFDVRAYQQPDLSVPREGGYGVFIIRELMDEVDYDTSDAHGTTLRLTRRRRPRGGDKTNPPGS